MNQEEHAKVVRQAVEKAGADGVCAVFFRREGPRLLVSEPWLHGTEAEMRTAYAMLGGWLLRHGIDAVRLLQDVNEILLPDPEVQLAKRLGQLQ